MENSPKIRKTKPISVAITLLFCALLFATCTTNTDGEPDVPMTMEQVLDSIRKSGKDNKDSIGKLILEVSSRGVQFRLNDRNKELLKNEGAPEELIEVIWKAAVNYSLMSDDDKDKFISTQAGKILDRFGRTKGDDIPPAGIESIRAFVDGYVRRIREEDRTDSCAPGQWTRSDLASVLKRGKLTAPKINAAFEEKELDPAIGLYLAMIESEFCQCLQSPTGPLGMYQFTSSMGRKYGLETKRGASPEDPDERCSVAESSNAAAALTEDLIGYTKRELGTEFGKNANGTLFALAAINSGEGALKENFSIARESTSSNETVNFWRFMANADKLSEQFRTENVKYVPKFLAAAIVGENPESFGLTYLDPLSSVASESSENLNVSIEYWKSQRDKAREKRNEPTGISPEGLEIPKELEADGVVKQTAKLREMRDEGFALPLDFADLAKKRNDGTLVELIMANKYWVIDTGGSTTQREFTSFNFDDHSESPIVKPGSPDHKVLSQLAEDFSGDKYDLNNRYDRRLMKMRLLRMLSPSAKKVLEELAGAYHAKFQRPLIVLGLTRSMEYQIEINKINAGSFKVRGAESLPPHTSGYAFDLARKHMTADEQNFIMEKLEEMEQRGTVDALIEGDVNAVFHVFVYQNGRPPKGY